MGNSRVYSIYCRQCGQPVTHRGGHIADIYAIRSGVNCGRCYPRVPAEHRAALRGPKPRPNSLAVRCTTPNEPHKNPTVHRRGAK